MSEQKIQVDLSGEHRVALKPEFIFNWLIDFPNCLLAFPVLKDVQDLKKGNLARIQVGPFGYRQHFFKSTFICELKIVTPGRVVEMNSIPGEGNTGLHIKYRLEPDSEGQATKIKWSLSIVLPVKLPRLVSAKMVQLALEKTIAATLEQGFQQIGS